MNRVGVIIPHKSYQTSVRNGRLHGLSLVTKAKMAVEGDVLEKESVGANDKSGNSSLHITAKRLIVNIDHYPAKRLICLYLLAAIDSDYGVVSVHHVGILCENLERSLEFYQNILGMLCYFSMLIFA